MAPRYNEPAAPVPVTTGTRDVDQRLDETDARLEGIEGGTIPPGLEEALDARYGSVVFVDAPTGGDDTTLIQDAIDEAATLAVDAMGAATVVLKGDFNASGLSIPGQVHLTGQGASITANAAGPIITVDGNHSRISQIFFQGGGAAVDASGVTFSSGTRWSKIESCRFDQFALQAVLFASGSISNEASSLFAQNCLRDADSLATYAGVVEMAGTDCWLHDSELTASRTALSTNSYACAVAVTGANNFIRDVQAEISDMGVYVNAAQTRITSVRADLNRGHGFYIAAGSGSIMGCLALSNGLDANGTYDGFHFVAGNWLVDGNLAQSLGSPAHRFGFYDGQNSFTSFCTFGPANRSLGQVGSAISHTPFAGGRITPTSGPVYSITANATSFNVQAGGWPHNSFYLQANAPTNFTDFTSEVGGLRISVFGDGQTTIVHDVAKIVTSGGASFLTATGVVYEFINRNGVWYQL